MIIFYLWLDVFMLDEEATSRFCLDIIENEPAVGPPHQEEAVQRHAEVVIVHVGDILDVDPCK